MSNASMISGQLSEFRLVELLQMFGLGSNTGALHLRQPSGHTGLLYFEGGALASCTELDTEALTLGHVLQQLDLASATQIDHAFQLQTHDPLGKRIGERLVDLNIISPEQLSHALKTQTLWTARELALWDDGTYEFHRDECLPAADHSSQHIDNTQVVMEVLRYEHEWERLKPWLPNGMRTHLIMANDAPLDHPLSFHASAWRIISRVNSQRTVRRIATSLHTPEVDVARMLGPLVREGLLVPLGAAGGPGLPEEAERLSMHRFDLFTLLVDMEQTWLKSKTPLDKLVALAGFINQTMRTLEEACQASGLELAPDTLTSILTHKGLLGVGDHRFRIENNHIDTERFASYCRQVFDGSARGSLGTTGAFYDTCESTLVRALAAAFESINMRIASPIERMQNQEAWEALFLTLGNDGSGVG